MSLQTVTTSQARTRREPSGAASISATNDAISGR